MKTSERFCGTAVGSRRGRWLLSALLLVAASLGGVAGEDTDLNNAHRGTIEIDTALLNRAPQPPAVQAFFEVARGAFEKTKDGSFAGQTEIGQAAQENGFTHLGGPMLGTLADDGARVWVRTIQPAQVTVVVDVAGSGRRFGPVASTLESDLTALVAVTGLSPATSYPYRVLVDEKPITMPKAATLTTAPAPGTAGVTRIAFGADFHKSGLWQPGLMAQVRGRGNLAMLLLGDNAADDRVNHVGLHRSDYLLRDLSPYWQELVASVPVYASWDDHDYFNNDLSGIPPRFTAADRTAVRQVWTQCWNNPSYGNTHEGIFFHTRIGPCDLIMLDTRFFRTAPGQADCFLGKAQMGWLAGELAACKSPFIILTSGTMWSDSISNGKDSWGKWDPSTRERILAMIEERAIGGVLLLSGDRHGARVIQLPRPSGFVFNEFEMGSLGAHEGPGAFGKNQELQPFGVSAKFAFGEFTFDTAPADPTVTFRAVDIHGAELFKAAFTRSQLTPHNAAPR